ncbi:hypothetical protein KTI62_04640 [Acinetobacter schindleri]|uniref:hypothetical protein n=1 Tax=Acinetobacter TaxID=469 RepID=UPI0002CE06DB|nr:MULTISPECIES: hypothetical protein [Acinetobacter]ENX00814.1 hypothetical protein F899_02111 [Acinetobacter sp. CIP 101934]MCU4519479.1 hypothetical protein [Acinetobacter schindleri]
MMSSRNPNQELLEQLQQEHQKEQMQQQQQPQHGPINSPKNNQHEQDQRVFNKQHRKDLHGQDTHGNHSK